MYSPAWLHLSQPLYPVCDLIPFTNARTGASQIIAVTVAKNDFPRCSNPFFKLPISSVTGPKNSASDDGLFTPQNKVTTKIKFRPHKRSKPKTGQNCIRLLL